MDGLKGKSVIVSGAAQGIGYATVVRFLKEGAKVLAIDTSPHQESELARLEEAPLSYIQGDITTPKTLENISDHIEVNGVDILINNAGIIRDAPLGKMTRENFSRVLEVNLTAVFELSQLVAPTMREQGSGVILNAASVVAHYGNYGQANYAASKAGVVGLTKTLARELGKYSIRVNAVAPGFIQTPMVSSIPPKVQSMMRDKTPLGRLGRPQEVAGCYAFLASDDGAFINGAVLNVDGGLILG